MNTEGTEDAGAALVPQTQELVDFYGDPVPVARTEDGELWVPLRPLTDFLGLAFGSQSNRVRRDEVLAARARLVVMARSDGRRVPMLALPLDMLPGWLFGVTPGKVSDELREKLKRYRAEAFRVLWEHFRGDVQPAAPPSTDLSGAELAVENARALLHLAEQQLEFERRLNAISDYMRPFVRDTRQRLTALEVQLSAGATISESDAAEIQLAVKNVGSLLKARGGMTGYQQVYAELYRRFRVGAYRNLPAARLQEALDWLRGWYDELADADSNS